MITVKKRNKSGFSLIETMTVITVIAIVIGLLYAYSDQGWKLFYQSYGRGLSQTKAKLAIRTISEDLREANKARLTIGYGTSYGVPTPDDIKENTPHIYFTKPVFHEGTGNIIEYNYVLYYFAKQRKDPRDKNELLVLKSIRFTNQSKFYTEDKEKTWPFLPPVLELNKSRLPEDESYIETLKLASASEGTETGDFIEADESKKQYNQLQEEQFLDHFSELKKTRKNIPISGNFLANSLTDSFSTEEVSIFFGNSYSSDNPIKIKVSLEESPFLFGLMAAMTEFEVAITPRN